MSPHVLLCSEIESLTAANAAGEVAELGALQLPAGEDTLVVIVLHLSITFITGYIY